MHVFDFCLLYHTNFWSRLMRNNKFPSGPGWRSRGLHYKPHIAWQQVLATETPQHPQLHRVPRYGSSLFRLDPRCYSDSLPSSRSYTWEKRGGFRPRLKVLKLLSWNHRKPIMRTVYSKGTQTLRAYPIWSGLNCSTKKKNLLSFGHC